MTLGVLLALGSSAIAALPPASAAGGHELAAGAELAPGEALTSPSGQYRLGMQFDGNLVLSTQGRVLWAAGTSGNPGARAVMQHDGNLVVYDGSVALWNARTDGHPGALLRVQDDGNLVVYAPGSNPVWATGTFNDRLLGGETLTAGHYLRSPSGQYRLGMQFDGNLVLSSQGRVLWAAGTSGNPGARAVMQHDGNLVVYDGGVALWNARTGGHSGALLRVQDDGNLVVYAPGSNPVWATGTTGPVLWLPWAAGESWYLTNRPHGSGSSALDFQAPGGVGTVRAAAAGVVRVEASCLVTIDHLNGWVTEYRHLLDARAELDGTFVARGTALGGNGTGCGVGEAPHLHFALKRHGQYTAIQGVRLGSWVVDGGGCLSHDDGRRRCATSLVDNSG